MSKYGDLDYFVNEAEQELAEGDDAIEVEDDLVDEVEPRHYWNGISPY